MDHTPNAAFSKTACNKQLKHGQIDCDTQTLSCIDTSKQTLRYKKIINSKKIQRFDERSRTKGEASTNVEQLDVVSL